MKTNVQSPDVLTSGQLTVTANGISLCYQTLGRPEDPPLLLVMGLGAQMTVWPDELCLALARSGRYVIRFDNRDVGLSTKTEGEPPDITDLMAKATDPEDGLTASDVPYTLSDMAADGVGLLDALGIETAHVVGASMGGMIAQHLAIEQADRIRSVTSVMSTTGNSEVGQPSAAAIIAMMRPPPESREAAIEQGVVIGRIISGPLWVEADARRRAAESYDRMFHPAGAAFQLAAVMTSGDRTERLAEVQVPFLVIHGRADALVDVSGGVATAEAVPGADLFVLHDMGHDLPRPLLPQITAAVYGLTERVERAS
jgi:pimeloyl-ACP methyl ester carboxylesterase